MDGERYSAHTERFQELEIILQRHGSNDTCLAEEHGRHSRHHKAVDGFFILFDRQLLPFTPLVISAEAIHIELTLFSDREDFPAIGYVHSAGKEGLEQGVVHTIVSLLILERGTLGGCQGREAAIR